MAKKIKFPLSMKNDAQVRDLDELREHFDLDKTIGYFLDGKLLSWLEARYYDTEADAVRALNKDDADVHRRLCEIFGVEYHAEEAPKIDVEAVEERNRRLSELKQYTSDPAVLEKVDQVAFNQEELADLIDEGYSDIYLCNNSFVIPLRVRNKHYIGVGKAEAVIRSQERVDFEELGIRFDDVKFDESYEKLTHETPEELYRKGCEAEDRKDYATALEYFRKVADTVNRDAFYKLGVFYGQGYGVTPNFQESLKWYQKSADLGDMYAMKMLGLYHHLGLGTPENEEKSLYWYTKAAEAGESSSMYYLGKYYRNGDHYPGGLGLKWYTKAAEAGDTNAMMVLAIYYQIEFVHDWQKYPHLTSYGDGHEDDLEAIKWLRRAAESNDENAINSLASLKRVFSLFSWVKDERRERILKALE